MDFLKEFEKIGKVNNLRDEQERASIMRKPDEIKLPSKPNKKVSVGEYYPKINDTIELIQYLSTHPTMPLRDREYLKKELEHIPEYEEKGLYLGTINSVFIFFAPGIRRLAFYKRLPIASLFFFYWVNWGTNYGKDLVFIRSRNIIENWERDMGIRHWQTGL